MRGWCVALLVGVGLSGCLGIVQSNGSECRLDNHDCTMVADGWLLEDLHLDGDARLVVQSGPVLTVRNVIITGADRIDLDVTCECTVRGEGFLVEGLGLGTYGVWLQAGQGSWSELPDGVRLDGIEIRNLGRGIIVGPSAGVVTVANATIDCPAGGGAFEFDAGPNTRHIRILDSTTDGCARVGISQRPEGLPAVQVDIVRSDLRGAGMEYGVDGVAGTAGTQTAVRVIDSTISGVRYALRAGEGDSIEVRNSTISGSDAALQLSDDGTAVLDGATLEGNSYGVRAWDGARLEARGSIFLNNGSPPFGACGAAVAGELTGFIHASAFEGNQVAVDVYPFGFDATGNYWGLPTGPVAITGCQLRSDAVQQIATGVAYLPFLTQAP